MYIHPVIQYVIITAIVIWGIWLIKRSSQLTKMKKEEDKVEKG